MHNVRFLEEGGVKYLQCDAPDCCGAKFYPGLFLEEAEVREQKNKNILEKMINEQKNMMYLNYMPHSLDKLKHCLS